MFSYYNIESIWCDHISLGARSINVIIKTASNWGCHLQRYSVTLSQKVFSVSRYPKPRQVRFACVGSWFHVLKHVILGSIRSIGREQRLYAWRGHETDDVPLDSSLTSQSQSVPHNCSSASVVDFGVILVCQRTRKGAAFRVKRSFRNPGYK